VEKNSVTPGRSETHELVETAVTPSAEELRRMCELYFDLEAPAYDAFDDAVEKRRRYCDAIDRQVIELLGQLSRCERIVSFGCGTGRRDSRIAAEVGQRTTIIGIEQAPRMASIAKGRGLTVVADIDDPDLPAPGSVQAALCLSSFVHVSGERARLHVLGRLFDLLGDDGILVLDVFNIDDRFEWGDRLRHAHGDALYRRIGQSRMCYMHYFSLSEIARLVEGVGFVVQHVTGVGWARDPGRIGVPLDEGCLFLSCAKRSDSGGQR
jgi:SAM-dependent methyltransferase